MTARIVSFGTDDPAEWLEAMAEVGRRDKARHLLDDLAPFLPYLTDDELRKAGLRRVAT